MARPRADRGGYRTVTLYLSPELKRQVITAALEADTSVTAWLVEAAQRNLQIEQHTAAPEQGREVAYFSLDFPVTVCDQIVAAGYRLTEFLRGSAVQALRGAESAAV